MAVGRLWNETRPLNEVTSLMYGRLPSLSISLEEAASNDLSETFSKSGQARPTQLRRSPGATA